MVLEEMEGQGLSTAVAAKLNFAVNKYKHEHMNDDKERSTKIERAKQKKRKDKRTLVQQQIDEASKQSDELLRNVKSSSSFHPSAIVQKLLSGFWIPYLTRKPLFALRWN
jgi:hypothetical protein